MYERIAARSGEDACVSVTVNSRGLPTELLKSSRVIFSRPRNRVKRPESEVSVPVSPASADFRSAMRWPAMEPDPSSTKIACDGRRKRSK